MFELFLVAAVRAGVPHGHGVVDPNACMGEFSRCDDNSCTLGPCGLCPTAGQYLCPDLKTCVRSAAAYIECPGIVGTHLDHTLDVEARIAYLVAHTTLKEQAAQLKNMAPAIARPNIMVPAYNYLNDDEHGIKQPLGTIFPDGPGLGAGFAIDTAAAVGRAIGIEARALHNSLTNKSGFCCNGVGITAYAPNMNLVKDPRWGRAQEVYSEDPQLSSQITVALVTGMQGNPSGVKTADNGYIMTGGCCKHYAAYNIETHPVDRHHFDAQVQARDLWETYLPVFEACVSKAKGSHVMCSYNALNGKPTCAHKELLTDILRTKFKFDGFVVSDYDAWKEIRDTHNFAATYEDAAAIGLNAGLDQEGGFGNYPPVDAIPSAVAAGKTTAAAVANSFGNLMRIRIRLGMLDPPTLVPFYNATFNATLQNLNADRLDVALTAAVDGMTLLKNAKNVLPLTAGEVVAVPSALACVYTADTDANQPGNPSVIASSETDCCAICAASPACAFFSWQSYPNRKKGPGGVCWLKPNDTGKATSKGITFGACPAAPTPAAKQILVVGGQAADGFSLMGNYVDNDGPLIPSVSILSGIVEEFGGAATTWVQGCSSSACPETDFSAASKAVKEPTVGAVVVVLGLNDDADFGCGTDACESEAHDRSVIELFPNQLAQVAALRTAIDTASLATKPPLICVLVNGGTLALGAANDQCDAILAAWYPGQMGGTAVASVLSGKVSPAGRSPTTWYTATSDLPPMGEMSLYPNATSGTKGSTYRFFTGTPLYPFGYGLSYTSFNYSKLTVASPTVKACNVISLTVDVTNTGAVKGDEVVQLYAVNSTAKNAPRVRLGDFTRLRGMAPGETRTVTLSLEPSYHAVVTQTVDPYTPQIMVNAGQLAIFVGGGQPQGMLRASGWNGMTTSGNGVDASVTVSNTQDLETC